SPPSPVILWLLWLFLCRFMFSSGAAKLTSKDPTWRDLTAMSYHYETQPIPNPLSWYAHQLPMWVQKASTVNMFILELLVPFLVFGPPPFKLGAFIGLCSLQLLIMVTGNFCFFNLLSIILCIPLLNNDILSFLTPYYQPMIAPQLPFMNYVIVSIGVVLIGCQLLQFLALFTRNSPLFILLGILSPFKITSSYGLFAVMTTHRYEIDIEGSEDGHTWKLYPFKWKPGNMTQRPSQFAPYHPRLDWQLWFVALRPNQTPLWFNRFLKCLLENKTDVLHLLKSNPFPDSSPQFIRIVVNTYRFTTPEEKYTTKAWWKRKVEGTSQPISLENLEI
ncbi:MAG: lipase maturation factor family protein, partial [Candidatus Margulisbacteria bacterium]|nr:lipase maturation factor family protein [Candidatus Margulisiibacteriota bacterium]